MFRVKITLSYDGSDYYGSQIQPDKVTIHSKVLDVFKVLNIDSSLDFSGRTDKGVHAFRQTISCDIPDFWDNIKLLKSRMNKLLPNSIFVRDITKAKEDFHSRFSAKQREYRYLITNKRLNPFNSKYVTYYEDINPKRIKEAIDLFIGIHDFEYFSKKGSEPVSTTREIYDIKFYKYKDIYVLNFKANSYLRSQIRMMVDFIMKISSNKLSNEDLINQLTKQKLISWTLAPANGLYLSKIFY
ncbi:MAG: tRNA pseudouridine(38-40) synthase TruA [Campylobacterota bacterium]|nr:tRNA pseudouridine(38-40) synthase TruA [Campylobacterota bacterium]